MRESRQSTRVLVVGGAGYIGSHTAKALAQAGFEPVVFDNLSEGHRYAVRWGALVEGDLADKEKLIKTLEDYRIDAVIQFAASAYVGESVENPRKYFRNNVTNTLNLLDAMLDADIKHLVFSSTCATYGEPENVPMDEAHPQAPINPYGETKLIVEKALRWYAQAYELDYVALRYFNASGADASGLIGEDHDPETHLIPLILQAASGEREQIDIYGTDYPTEDGTAVRDYIHVTDLARAHVKALEYLQQGGKSDAFNLGTGQGYSVREMVQTAERVSGRPINAHEAPRRPGDPPRLVADPSKAAEVLGWRAEHDLETIVQSAWHWHRKQLEASKNETSKDEAPKDAVALV